MRVRGSATGQSSGPTYIEWRVFSFSKVIDVGDAQRCDWGFSNPPQSVPQEHIDPHVGTRLSHAGCMTINNDK